MPDPRLRAGSPTPCRLPDPGPDCRPRAGFPTPCRIPDPVPIPDPVAERAKQIVPMTGDMPSPMNPPSGCVFRGRCPRAQADCAEVVPEPGRGAHQVACIHPGPMQENEVAVGR